MLLDMKLTGWGTPSHPTARRTELFSDWIEAQAFVSGAGTTLSKPDLVDRLEGTSLAADSDHAWTLVNDAFGACKRRAGWIGQAYPFVVDNDHLKYDEDQGLSYLFCLLVSLPEQLKVLRTSYSTEFRDIFEAVVVEALRAALPDWDVHLTGWSTIAGDGKKEIVGRVGQWSLARHWDKEVFPNANDAQVDIAAVRPFGDLRSAYPVFLGQCATGVTDWKVKASRPNLDRWIKAVQFTSNPSKLFAVPFSLDDSSFWEATVECSGLVLDRTRICMKLPTVSVDLATRIQEWMGKAKASLPLAA